MIFHVKKNDNQNFKKKLFNISIKYSIILEFKIRRTLEMTMNLSKDIYHDGLI